MESDPLIFRCVADSGHQESTPLTYYWRKWIRFPSSIVKVTQLLLIYTWHLAFPECPLDECHHEKKNLFQVQTFSHFEAIQIISQEIYRELSFSNGSYGQDIQTWVRSRTLRPSDDKWIMTENIAFPTFQGGSLRKFRLKKKMDGETTMLFTHWGTQLTISVRTIGAFALYRYHQCMHDRDEVISNCSLH